MLYPLPPAHDLYVRAQVCIMVGSSIFTMLVQRSMKLESIALIVLAFAMASLSVPIFAVVRLASPLPDMNIAACASVWC